MLPSQQVPSELVCHLGFRTIMLVRDVDSPEK